MKSFTSGSIRVMVEDSAGEALEDILSVTVTDAPDAPESVSLDSNTITRFEPMSFSVIPLALWWV